MSSSFLVTKVGPRGMEIFTSQINPVHIIATRIVFPSFLKFRPVFPVEMFSHAFQFPLFLSVFFFGSLLFSEAPSWFRHPPRRIRGRSFIGDVRSRGESLPVGPRWSRHPPRRHLLTHREVNDGNLDSLNEAAWIEAHKRNLWRKQQQVRFTLYLKGFGRPFSYLYVCEQVKQRAEVKSAAPSQIQDSPQKVPRWHSSNGAPWEPVAKMATKLSTWNGPEPERLLL